MDSKINQKSVKRFSCNACDKSYTQSHSLKSHIKIVHDGKKEFNCDICGNSFGRKQALETHLVLVHNVANVVLEEVESKKPKLKIQEKEQTTELNKAKMKIKKKFSCEWCDKSFTQSHRSQSFTSLMVDSPSRHKQSFFI